jgi:hypothetical protein
MSNAGGMDATLNRYSDMLAGNTVYTPPAFNSIATQTVGSGGASSITFSSIPSTYTHLQLRVLSKTVGGDYNDLQMNFNGDTGNNYAWHRMYGNGAVGVAQATTSTNYLPLLDTGSTQGSNVFAVNVSDILDYTNTNKYKVTRTLEGADNNGTSYIILSSGLWQNTSAITSITLVGQGGNFVQYSSFALYGIK